MKNTKWFKVFDETSKQNSYAKAMNLKEDWVLVFGYGLFVKTDGVFRKNEMVAEEIPEATLKNLLTLLEDV